MPLVEYRCAKCKMIRESYKDAASCEKSHLAAIFIRELQYKMGPYPYRVVLVFPDGNEREYTKVDY